MLVDIPQVSEFLKAVKATVLDDVIDRLNYFWTVSLLCLCALLIGAKQNFGEPIHCLISSDFTKEWIAYVHTFCFITGTYDYTDDKADLIRNHNYYQWVPFILFAMALAFYVPHFVWRLLQKSSQLDLKTAVKKAVAARELVGESRQETIGKVVDYAKRYMNAPNFGLLGYNAHFGMYSSLTYLFSKLLNCVNVVAQIYLINKYCARGDYWWGYTMLRSGLSMDNPANPNPFPRLTHCKFDFRDVGNTRSYETDCVIMINILNEKVFLLIWVWFHFVAFVTLANFIYSVVVIMVPSARYHVIANHLSLKGPKSDRYYEDGHGNKTNRHLDRFVYKVLSVDGVQLIRFIAAQAGGLVAHEVTRGIYDAYLESRKPAVKAIE